MSKEILELYRKLNNKNKEKIIKEIDYLLMGQKKNGIIELQKNRNLID